MKNYNSSPKMNSEIPNSHNFLTLYAQSHKLAERKWRVGEGEREDMGKRQEQELLVPCLQRN